MAEVQPPTWMEGGCYTAVMDRALLSSLVCEPGVVDAGDLEVTAASGWSVGVAAGAAFVEGTVTADQGVYHVVNDASRLVTLSPAHPSLARIDLVVARVYDSQYAGALDEWRLEAVAGTPAGSPSAPAVPDSSIVLAQVLLPAGSANIGAATITDQRKRYQSCGGQPREGLDWSWSGQSPIVVPSENTPSIPFDFVSARTSVGSRTTRLPILSPSAMAECG